jgi:hypothetical protein
MESEVPLMPMLLHPELASTVKDSIHFDWEDVSDSSGVAYSIQVSDDVDFTTAVLEKENLLRSQYKVTEEDNQVFAGEKSVYYWRVKAIDGAFNESDWTPPAVFVVDLYRTSIPDWIKYTSYAVGVLLVAILVFCLRKRILTVRG